MLRVLKRACRTDAIKKFAPTDSWQLLWPSAYHSTWSWALVLMSFSVAWEGVFVNQSLLRMRWLNLKGATTTRFIACLNNFFFFLYLFIVFAFNAARSIVCETFDHGQIYLSAIQRWFVVAWISLSFLLFVYLCDFH